MQKNLKTNPSHSSSMEVMGQLDQLTQLAADTLRKGLKTANLEEYKHFLDTMYHYTRNTGYKAKTAAENIADPKLKAFFMHMHREEKGHYMLALKDLEALGGTPTEGAPEEVKMFDAFWESLAQEHYVTYLGALYVFENIAVYLTQDIRDFIVRLNLGKKECRWLAVHAEADLDHGAEVGKLMKEYVEANPQAITSAAKMAAALWIGIMKRAFQI